AAPSPAGASMVPKVPIRTSENLEGVSPPGAAPAGLFVLFWRIHAETQRPRINILCSAWARCICFSKKGDCARVDLWRRIVLCLLFTLTLASVFLGAGAAWASGEFVQHRGSLEPGSPAFRNLLSPALYQNQFFG